MSLARQHHDEEAVALLRRELTTHPENLEARRLLVRANVSAGTGDEADSYVGLFQGVIETDTPAAQMLPPVLSAKPAARASGFLRLEVSGQKKATGCFLFFVDGKVLSGAIEGASNKTGFVDASFRLSPGRDHGPAATGGRPVAAVGRLHLEARHARGVEAPGEDLTIRFV